MAMSSGEMYDGIPMTSEQNDTSVLMEALGRACIARSQDDVSDQMDTKTASSVENPAESPNGTVDQILSLIQGPWALVYWQVCASC
jgi:hypothetical protein